jgi:5-methylthioadenosine/S-adenosylhomocysteine deaminase
VQKDPECIEASNALDMATVNAAKGLGWSDVGVLKEGYKADIAIVDMNNINLFPNNNTLSSLVYAGRGSDVCCTMIDGKFVYKNGKYLTVDEKDIRKKFMEKFIKLYK